MKPDEIKRCLESCAGSGTTLRASAELNRNSYGFEIDKNFCRLAKEKMLSDIHIQCKLDGF